MNVSSTGTFVCPKELGTDSTITRGTSACPTGWTVVNPNPICFTPSASGTCGFYKTGDMDDPTLKYKVGTGSWTDYTVGTDISCTSGTPVYFYGTNSSFSKGTNAYIKFMSTAAGNVSGNVMELLAETNTSKTIPANNCFNYLFYGSIATFDNLLLPATELKDYCYFRMFFSSTGIKTPPALPATTLKPSCYAGMFYGCTNLTSAPEIKASVLSNNCYEQMFLGCSGLTSAPDLPATTLASNCYSQMFQACSSLTTAPVLPAKELISGCYKGMFQGCSKLSYIEVAFINPEFLSAQYTTSWVTNVNSAGTFKCALSLGNNSTITRDSNSCPTNFNVINTITYHPSTFGCIVLS